MILPSGRLEKIIQVFLRDDSYNLLGCLSTEQRSTAVPLAMMSDKCKKTTLVKVIDPLDAFPNRSAEANININKNEKLLKASDLIFTLHTMNLLASEDELLEILNYCGKNNESQTLILDITSFPKRYFCFLVKILLKSPWENVLVTYTDSSGYPGGHLSEDPMTSDCLPGYTTSLSNKKNRLVIAAGFESLGIRTIMEQYAERPLDTRIILSFPPDGNFIKRQWQTLSQLYSGNPERMNTNNIKVIAAWDSEETYLTLNSWHEETSNLILAPYGAKPHTLGMALFASSHDCALIYTQPKSYNPFYTEGQGEIWGYVIKWEGIPCYSRTPIAP